MLRSLTRLSLLAAVTACASSSRPVADPGTRQHEHPRLPATLNAFHEVLSPIWHTAPGADRVAAACTQATILGARATALVGEPPPAEASGKADVWKVRTATLATEVEGLARACGADGRPEVETRLGAVHEAFHHVGMVVSDMGDHGDHRPPGGSGHHGGPGEH